MMIKGDMFGSRSRIARVFLLLCIIWTVSAQQCSSPPYCKIPCDCDRSASLTTAADTRSANLTVADAGLYTVRLVTQTRCGFSANNISVNAQCADPVPLAMIVQPLAASVCSTKVHQPINLVGAGYVNSGNNATLSFCWCVASAPQNSAKLLVGRTSSNATFTPDVPGEYWVRLTVRNGCSPSFQHLFINATCSCPPIASAGASATPIYTGIMPYATPLTSLSGSFSFNSEGSYVNTSYRWSLTSWSNSAGWNMTSQTVPGTNDILFNFVPTVQLIGGSSSMTTMLGQSNTTSPTSSSTSYYLGASGTQIQPISVFSRPTTSGLVIKTFLYREVTTTTTYQEVSVNPSNFAQCSVRIFNYTSSEASFQATPYDRCIGLFRVNLQVSSECGSSSDYEDLTVGCAQRPRANLMCMQTVLYNRTTSSFQSVTIDGRDSTPNMYYNWSITPPGLANLVFAPNAQTATLNPLKPGIVQIRLDVSDSFTALCPPTTATVNITIGCGRISPAFTVTQLQQPSNFQGSAFTIPAVFNVTVAASYPTPSDIRWSWALQQQQITGWQTVSSATNLPGSSAPLQITTPINNAGTYQLLVTGDDGCSNTVVTSSQFSASCAAGGLITPRITFPSCSFNGDTATFNISGSASTSTVPAGRTATYSWSALLGTTVLATGAQNAADIGVALSTMQFTSTSNSVTLTVAVGDGCQNATVSQVINCNCPTVNSPFTTPTPTAISLTYYPSWNSSGVVTGVFQNVTISPQLVNGFTLSSGQSLTWSFAAGTTNPSLSQLSAVSGIGPIVFIPISSGSYSLVAQWSNNCTAVFKQTFQINVACPAYQAPTVTLTSDEVSIPATGSTVSFNYAAGRYPNICFYYKLPDANLLLHGPIYYTWNVVSSPQNSIWGFTANDYMMTSNFSDSTTNTVVSNFLYNITTVRSYQRTNYTGIYSQVAVLPDHGYDKQPSQSLTYQNLAQTCLRPDLPGTYVVSLAAADSCSGTTQSYSFTAATCPLTATVAVSNANGSPALTVYSRVLLVVSASVGQPTEYVGSIVSRPCASQALPQNGLTNSQGPEMSFVPDAAGTYVIQINVRNDCGMTSLNTTVVVTCDTTMYGNPSQLCNYPAAPATLAIDGTMYASNLTIYGGNDTFAQPAILTVGTYSTPVISCTKNKYSWGLLSYGCPLAYVPPPPPPVPVLTCAPSVNYLWEVVGAPCNSTFTPVANGTLFLSNDLALAFTPDKKGVYTLRFTASDGCATASQNVTVTTTCFFKPVVTAGNNLINAEYCPTSRSISSVPLSQANIQVTMSVPDPSARVLAPQESCPVLAPAPSNNTCGDVACVCNVYKCQQSLTVAKTGCYCVCSDGSVGTGTNNNGGLNGGNSTTGGFNNGFNTNNGNTTGGVNGINGANNGGNTTNNNNNGGQNAVNGNANNGGNGNSVIPTGSNALDQAAYNKDLDDAKAALQKYLVAIWAGAMTPMSVGLAGSVAYNTVQIIKYKSLLFGQGASGGVEMSTAPAMRPLG